MSVGKHYQMCCDVAKFIRKKPWCGIKYVAVELICCSACNADVWATNGYESFQIEVKMSHTDFLNDKKKFARTHLNYECGNYRYYCAPKGIIKETELPQHWGLIEFEENVGFSYIKEADYQECNNRTELSILCSILRREKIKPQIFNYRNERKNI